MPHRVAALLLLLLLPLAAASEEAPAAAPAPALAEPVAAAEAALLERHAAQLARLEELAESLAASVRAIESALARSADPDPPPPGASAAAVGDRRSPQGVAVTKRRPVWSERFHFAAAARLGEGAYAAAAATLPYEDADGLTKYFAVGDSRGRVFVFSAAGDALLELEAAAAGEPQVTALLAYLSPRRTDCLLFTGHADGSIAAHRLIESSPHGDDWVTLAAASSRLLVRGLDAAPVVHLEAHHAGRARYVLSCDAGGRIRVFTENGTLYGTAIASSTPLAFVKQRLLFLTEAGAASLDLRSMSVRETPCEGLAEALNGTTRVKAYSFDPSERFKAYGFTEAGDLVHVLLLGDVSSLKCRVRAAKKSEIDSPVAIQTIKGYLLVASQDKILVYNTSSQYYGRVGAPRPLFATTIKDIKSVFAASGGMLASAPAGKPVIAADREKLVILGLGDGHIAIYRSNFPVYKPESNAVVWSGPALLFLLFLIGIWQVYVKKKDSLGWTPEETFNTSVTAPTGSLLNHPTSDRAFADSTTRASDRGYVDGTSRASDRSYVDATTRTTDRGYADASRAVDLRGGALRSAPRRYVSPTRYAGTSGIQYRPASSEPGLRGTPELKYRGPGMEPPGFPKKRDTLFSNNQAVVDDHAIFVFFYVTPLVLMPIVDDMKSVFVASVGLLPTAPAGKPVIAADRKIQAGEQRCGMEWSSAAFPPFLIGIWQVYVKKKDSLGWTAEETFYTSVTAPTGSLLMNHPTSDRAFADSTARASDRGYVDGTSRASDRSYVDGTTRTTDRGYADTTRAVDLRGGALRSAPIRDKVPRPRHGAPWFPQKEDPLFSTNQAVVDDHRL
ncbi:hypothetical protein U9M48_030062 [Paspalum notatum var. saurae]|uniref:Uncharacterized protein n=1 Tax=Paspalum notatum var. saurae TaxID=547442 RepID=A0AAQ3U0R5_PASNO